MSQRTNEPGKTCTKCRAWKPLTDFPRDKDRSDGRRSHCKECGRAASRRYRETNPGKAAEYAKQHVRDPVAVRRYSRTWRAANVEAAREYTRRYRARQVGADVGPVDIEAVWARDAGVCQLCRRDIDRGIPWPDPMSMTLDHRTPLSRGGLHVIDNVTLAHLGCNQRKGNRSA